MTEPGKEERDMNHLRLIPVAVLTAALLGGLGLPTFMPSVGTAVAQEEEEEQVQTKNRGKKKTQGQVSKPGVEKKSKKKQGLVVEENQKKSKKKAKSKKMPGR
jgi:hypothetical protein